MSDTSVKEIMMPEAEKDISAPQSEEGRLRREARELRSVKRALPDRFRMLEKRSFPEYDETDLRGRTLRRYRKEYARRVRECKVWNAQVDGLNAELEREYRLKCAEIEKYNADLERRAADLEAQAELYNKK